MNIRGLYPKSNRTKVAYLSDLASESNAPFIAIQESHLSQDILSEEVQIQGYNLFRSDRQGGRTHGGVATFIREDITVKECFKYSNNVCESQILEVKELGLTLVNIYRPPNSPSQLFEETLEKCQTSIDEIMESESKSKTLLVVGDFNFPFIKWPNKKIYLREQEPEQQNSEKKQGKLLLDWAEVNFLEQYICSPTRRGNILDLVFSNSSVLINGYSMIINFNFSDHNILKLSLNLQYKNDDTNKKRLNPYPNQIYEFDLLNASQEDWIRYDILLTKLSQDFDLKTENENTEERLKRFYKIIEDVVLLLFEKKEAFKDEKDKNENKKNKNKIPKKIRILLRKQTSLSKKILSSNSGIRNIKLMTTLQKIEKELEESNKKQRMKNENEAMKRIKRNPKYFYSYAKKFSKSKNKVGPLTNEDGETVKDNFEMTELLRKQYESTFSEPDHSFNIYNLNELFWNTNDHHQGEEEQEECVSDPGERGEQEEEEESVPGENNENTKNNEVENMENEEKNENEKDEGKKKTPKLEEVYFSYEDIKDAINQLSVFSGPGPDGIPAILLKKSKVTISLMLQNIFRHSIENGDIPTILKLGYICPILKPNSRRDKPSSWRPVSLTSHVIKTLERVLRRQIVFYLEEHNLMDPNQHGSRSRRSCLSQLLQHHDEVLRMLEEGGNVDVIYTDFEKAYEKVDHVKLLEKCKLLGISGKLGKWLQNFLENRTQQVLIEGIKSETSSVKSGSVQGSVLGPVLFLIYITDIAEDVTSNVKLFVNDAKVKRRIEDENDVENLQSDLEKLYCWQKRNNMKFNGDKFQALQYGPNEDIKNNTIYFTAEMEDVIERFSSLRDLGVILSDDGKFEDHIDKVSRSVRQKIGWIRRTFYCRKIDFLKHMWKTLVQVHIDYCSQLYMPGQSQGLLSIEKLFYDFTSQIPEVRELDYWSRLEKLKMISQEKRMERYRIIYIWKILEGLAPNCGIELAPENERLGRRLKIPTLKSGGRQAIQSLREQTLQINGARLFNIMPRSIREMKVHQQEFKEALDTYLSSVPDHPKIRDQIPAAVHQVTGRHCNSLLAWIKVES